MLQIVIQICDHRQYCHKPQTKH